MDDGQGTLRAVVKWVLTQWLSIWTREEVLRRREIYVNEV